MDFEDNRAVRVERMRSVSARTGLCPSDIYVRIAKGTFPKPIALGERAQGFISTEIDNWIKQRSRATNGQAPGLVAHVEKKALERRRRAA